MSKTRDLTQKNEPLKNKRHEYHRRAFKGGKDTPRHLIEEERFFFYKQDDLKSALEGFRNENKIPKNKLKKWFPDIMGGK